MPKIGLTMGKFMPLHKGHELLLETAVTNCDYLRVMVGITGPTSPWTARAHVVRSFLGSFNPENRFCTLPDYLEQSEMDQFKTDRHGTVVEGRFWSRWLDVNAEALADVDVVFTSDRYGAEVARRIEAEWFPVDPDREVHPICSTNIRNGLGWDQVSDFAKMEFCTTIAVVGAESTGKSTLTKKLAQHFRTSYAPEYGRIMVEGRGPGAALTSSDFSRIVDMQERLIRHAQKTSRDGLCFTDTEAFTTALFAPIYLGKNHSHAELKATWGPKWSFYLVMAPNVEAVQDGTRILDQEQREAFHSELLHYLREFNLPHRVISEISYENRLAVAVQTVERELPSLKRF